MESDIRGQLINGYLNAPGGDAATDGAAGGSAYPVQSVELPDNTILEEFKNQVRAWIEIDNQMRKLHIAMRERTTMKKSLTEKILKFMTKYNIEDLNTKDGSKLRYKVALVKPSMSKADLKAKLESNYDKARSVDELVKLVFDDDSAPGDTSAPRKERVSLKRLNVKNIAP